MFATTGNKAILVQRSSSKLPRSRQRRTDDELCGFAPPETGHTVRFAVCARANFDSRQSTIEQQIDRSNRADRTIGAAEISTAIAAYQPHSGNTTIVALRTFMHSAIGSTAPSTNRDARTGFRSPRGLQEHRSIALPRCRTRLIR